MTLMREPHWKAQLSNASLGCSLRGALPGMLGEVLICLRDETERGPCLWHACPFGRGAHFLGFPQPVRLGISLEIIHGNVRYRTQRGGSTLRSAKVCFGKCNSWF